MEMVLTCAWVQTAKELRQFLVARSRVEDFPLFNAVYMIAFEGHPVKEITELL